MTISGWLLFASGGSQTTTRRMFSAASHTHLTPDDVVASVLDRRVVIFIEACHKGSLRNTIGGFPMSFAIVNVQ
jgi:hypothetical protein